MDWPSHNHRSQRVSSQAQIAKLKNKNFECKTPQAIHSKKWGHLKWGKQHQRQQFKSRQCTNYLEVFQNNRPCTHVWAKINNKATLILIKEEIRYKLHNIACKLYHLKSAFSQLTSQEQQL